MENPERAFDIQKPPEHEINPKAIGIATATFYKNWYPGQPKDENRVDKTRGDLAIKTLQEATTNGYQVIVVDGGSSSAFRDTLTGMGVTVHNELERGMSGSRRQSFREVSRLPGVRAVVWTEPEKEEFIKNDLLAVASRVLQGTEDIIVPARDLEAFGTYPNYQAKYEKEANTLFNDILHQHNLLAEDIFLDAWFGPRILRNDPNVLSLFLNKYEYTHIPPITPKDEKHQKELNQIYNPELWSDATFLPIVNALQRGLRVVSIPVRYHHPDEQTNIEQSSEEFERKRDIQRKNIIIAVMNLIKQLEENPKSRLQEVT